MRLRVFDLDGSITAQENILEHHAPQIVDLSRWGPKIRLACRWRRFGRFEAALDQALGFDAEPGPTLTLVGSSDFRHVTLALLRRLREPFNLLVLDKHLGSWPHLPCLHHGNWLRHALRLGNLRQVFHLGGHFPARAGTAVRQALRRGRLRILPAVQTHRRGRWQEVPHEPLRPRWDAMLSTARLEALLWPHLDVLQRWPLYISLDKDVLGPADAVVNGEAGHLVLDEVQQILHVFQRACEGRLVGGDLAGDWSEVCASGLLRRAWAWLAHPRQSVDPMQAMLRNEAANLLLADQLTQEPEQLEVPRRGIRRAA